MVILNSWGVSKVSLSIKSSFMNSLWVCIHLWIKVQLIMLCEGAAFRYTLHLYMVVYPSVGALAWESFGWLVPQFIRLL